MSMSYSAYRGRTVLTLRLKLASPMHVGSGFGEYLKGDTEEVATIVIDGDKKPYIPPTTLKGAVRSLAVANHKLSEIASGIDKKADKDISDAQLNARLLFDMVFGSIKDNVDPGSIAKKGNPGWIVFSGASLVEAGALSGRIDEVGKSMNPGTILSKRTAIDDASGTADANKLFQARMVPPGAIFEARVTILRSPIDFNDAGVSLLLRVLASLKRQGVAMGRGKGDGYGLLKLEKISKLEEVRIDGGKVIQRSENDPAAWAQIINKSETKALDRSARRYVFTLASDEPFAVLGPDKQETQGEKKKGDNNKLRALRRSATEPDLPGSSLMGVLRSRAEWFARLQAMRAGKAAEDAEQYVRECIQPLFGEDANNLKAARLSGRASRTGFAGILRLHRVDLVKSVSPQVIDSVKVDRFSMGPFDGGLFGVEAFPKPSFEVELYLDERAIEADRAFMDEFTAWLTGESPAAGLMVGHAVNRGFGWFDVTSKGTAA